MRAPDPLREALTALADEWTRGRVRDETDRALGSVIRALLDAHPAPEPVVLAETVAARQAPTVALDVEAVAAELFALGPYCGDMCGEWVTACAWCKGHYGSMAGDLVAVDPRRTEAEVKAEALREAADELEPISLEVSAGFLPDWLRKCADQIAGAPDA